MLSVTSRSQPRRSLLVEVNPHQTLIASIVREARGPVVVEFAAEFEPGDNEAAKAWIDEKAEPRKHWVPAICSFVPRQGILQRETLSAIELADPGHLTDLIRDLGARRGASLAPYPTAKIEDWTFRAVNALGGKQPAAGSVAAPVLVVGMQNTEIQEVQQRMLDFRLLPQRIEPALLPLFGSLYQIMAHRRQSRAVVVFVIRSRSTGIYILGKEGVHTPGVVSQGLNLLVQQARKEFSSENDAVARERLLNADALTRAHARKLVRTLADELRPVLDSYEMTTGHPVGSIYCAYLHPGLAWLAEPLTRATGHEPMAVDCEEWMRVAGLERGRGVPLFGPQWLGALSLAANLPLLPPGKAEKAFGDTAAFQRPWHVDSRTATDHSAQRAVRRRTASLVALSAAVGLALLAAIWQWLAASTLRNSAEDWTRQLAQNSTVLDDLTASAVELRKGTDRLATAHQLMTSPFLTSEFLMNLGRTLPARMRIDRIEGNGDRVLLGGTLLEPAEEASVTLGRYMAELRQSADFGKLFPSITATSLYREGNNDVLAFEISLRLTAPRS